MQVWLSCLTLYGFDMCGDKCLYSVKSHSMIGRIILTLATDKEKRKQKERERKEG